MGEVTLRPIEPGDYERMIARLDHWWGGRTMTASLPRLFFDHFSDTARIAVDEQGEMVGFIVGFRSQADSSTAYVHFVGVAPEARGSDVGRTLYEWFFSHVAAHGCTRVKCLTSVVNTGSVAFHRALGFSVREARDHDGPGQHKMLFERAL